MAPTRAACFAISAPLLVFAAPAGHAAEPINKQGEVGLTSYLTLPFMQNVYYSCWNCSWGLEPAQLFFSANPSSPYLNAQTMSQARAAAAQQEAAGIIPSGGAQRWEDTYEASFPAGTFPGEPAYIQQDREQNNFPGQPEFVAWRNFVSANQQYWDTAYDGGTMPNQADYYRSWGGQWGHISPLTPLSVTDCPPDMQKGCNWGDSYAYRWAQTSAVSGGYGLMLSDFSDSQPYPSMLHDFNPGVLGNFATAYGLQAPLNGMTPSQAATWINGNAYTQWNDFLANGYAAFYGGLIDRIGKATGRKALLVDQCSVTPSYRRMTGTDQRLLLNQVSAKNYACIWDDQITQTGRAGPVAQPPMQELAGFIIGAAREPLVRNGANMEADDAAYWSAIATFYPSLDTADQQEVGYKLLKRLWLWGSWAHVATTTGSVRRALAFTSRDYWDAGSLSALDPLTSLIQGIIPTAPFGPALYYSVAVEKGVEQTEQTQGSPGNAITPYLPGSELQQFLDGGGGLGYYVSDIALPGISAAAGNAPSAWVVIDAQGFLPQAELQMLQATAPVVTSTAALSALPNQPVQASSGLSAFAFYDQHKRLIVTVSNPSTAPGAVAISGSVVLNGLSGTKFKVTDLFAGSGYTVNARNGAITLPIALSRWDTVVLAVSPSKKT